MPSHIGTERIALGRLPARRPQQRSVRPHVLLPNKPSAIQPDKFDSRHGGY
jgi:hypothetical protein